MQFILLILMLLWVNPSVAKRDTTSISPNVNILEIMGKIQKSWDDTKTYQVKFKQVVFFKTIGQRETTHGNIYVKKPDRVLWEPMDGNLEIINGKKLVALQVNKKRGITTVDIYNDFTNKVDIKPLTFLAGRAKVKDLYNPTLRGESKNRYEIKLTPKDGSSDIFIAEIDKESHVLLSLTTESVDTRSRLDFLETKSNLPLKDSIFE